MLLEIIVTLVWVACGVLAYGYGLAHLLAISETEGVERLKDILASLLLFFGGPVCLALVFADGIHKHGLRFK